MYCFLSKDYKTYIALQNIAEVLFEVYTLLKKRFESNH